MWTNGLQLAGGGTSFPSNPTTNDVFFRTDRGALFYYDGAAWQAISPSRHVCFRVDKNNSSQTVGTAATQVTWVESSSYAFDLANNFASNQFTAPEAGIYEFGFNIQFASVPASTQVFCYFRKNGSAINGPLVDSSYTSTITAVGNSGPLKLASGDTIDVAVQTTGASRSITGGADQTYFYGKRIA